MDSYDSPPVLDLSGTGMGGTGMGEAAPPDQPPAPPPTLNIGPSAPPTVTVGPAQSSSPNMGAAILLASITGAAVGGMRYGLRGAGVGFLLAGSASNAIRAIRLKNNPDQTLQSEALWSGLTAAVGLGLGGWLGYKLYSDAA